MPSLNWIGKKAVEKHHKMVPFHLLDPVPDLSFRDTESGNLIVQGDNLLALKALLPRYARQVKCIYIDPPYNTGNEGWIYNDNVNSPEIRKWLGEVVGKEGETLDRHDRWLCMMYPRLLLLKQFLREDGVIFVSIDDNEIGNLQALMREIFGPSNEVATIIWEKGKKGDSKLVSVTHEYVVVFVRNKALLKKLNVKWRKKKKGVDEVLDYYSSLRKKFGGDHAQIRKEMMKWYRGLPKDDPRKAHKHYNWSDERGLYFAADFAGPDDGRKSRPRYNILHPLTKLPCAIPSTGWRWEEPTTIKALAEDPPRIHFGKDHTTIPNRKSYLFEINEEPTMSVFYKDGRSATLEVESMLGAGSFPFPKDSEIISDLIGMVMEPGDIVLDSFAGSGTTAHAVLRLNQHMKEPLKFLLVELDTNVALNKTRERVRKVVQGYTPLTGKKQIPVKGLGGGFQYCRLSDEPLFKADGSIREDITFNQLAEFVWFMETGMGLAHSSIQKKQCSPFIGKFRDRAVFLLYNGILKDKSDVGGNVLNNRTLEIIDAVLVKFDGFRIVYGARNRFDKTKLERLQIVFHQLPYDLAVKTWF